MARRVTPNTEFIRAMFVGRSGSTKTRTAYSAVLDKRLGPVLALDAAGQPRSIREYRPKPSIIGLETVPDVTNVYRWLKRGQKLDDPYAREFELEPEGGRYNTVILDGIAEVQRWIGAGSVGNNNKDPGERLAALEFQHHGVVLNTTLEILSHFTKLPMHVIFTCLEQDRQEGENGPIYQRFALSGQSRDLTAQYFEIVGRLIHVAKVPAGMKGAISQDKAAAKELEGATSVCVFQPSARAEGKDQTGALGPFMIDPTMTKIMDLIETSAEEESHVKVR